MSVGPLALGLVLALGASLALNGSYVVQHLGSAGAPAISVRRPLASLGGLLRSPLWLAGAAAGMLGWALHVGALANAPLSLVQAFSAGGLALVVPLATRLTGATLGPAERRGIALMVVALVVLSLGATAPAVPAVPLAPLLAVLAVGGLLAAGLAAAPGGRRRAHALGLAAGVLYGLGDAATKAATVVAHAGVAAALASPWPAAVLLASAGAFFCFQRGLQIGPAVPVIALMTAATNLVAILVGVVVLGEPLGASLPVALAHAAALAAVGVAAWWLAPAQARLTEPERAGPECPAHTVATAPSANASTCSTPARSREKGISTTNTAVAPTASQRTTPVRRRVPASSAPSAAAQTAEIP